MEWLLRYQGSGFRPEQLSLQWSRSAGEEQYGDTKWVMFVPCWAVGIFGTSTRDQEALESKRWVQIWDVDLEVIRREMTFEARIVGDIIQDKCGEMGTDTMAKSQKHSIGEMRVNPGAHRLGNHNSLTRRLERWRDGWEAWQVRAPAGGSVRCYAESSKD